MRCVCVEVVNDFYQGTQVREFPGKFFARGPGASHTADLDPTQLTNHSPVSWRQPSRFMSVIDMSLKILISPACVYVSAGACEGR